MAKAPKDRDALRKLVLEILQQIRPAVQSDGGDIEFVDLDDRGVVSVRLHGACIGCPSSSMTLKMGIERAMKERLPEIREVICV